MTIKFFVHGDPQQKGSMRAFMPKGHKFPILTSMTGPKLKVWNQSVAVRALEARQDHQQAITSGITWPISAAVCITLKFFIARPKSVSIKKRPYHTTTPDLDKLVRGAMDPLKGVILGDDSQAVILHASKTYADNGLTPGCEFEISEIQPQGT